MWIQCGFPQHVPMSSMQRLGAVRGSLLTALLALGLVLLVVVCVFLLLDNRSPNRSQAVDTSASSRTNEQSTPSPTATTKRTPTRFRPTLRTRELQILNGPYFAVGYDNQRKNPAWVLYEIDGAISHPGASPTRPASFQTDFRTSAHVSHQDYTNSGFDRGHMYPAYAAWSRHGSEGFLATFTCSNIVPQPHSVNAGIWEELEEAIAGRHGRGGGWAEKLGHLTVINGPVYGTKPERLRAGVTIPESCFSIVLDWQEAQHTYRVLAFQIPNVDGTRGPLTRWITTIKRIETETGLNVFAGEAESLRAGLETKLAEALW